MRILHVVNSYLAYPNGYSIRTNYITRYQRILGLDPIVVVGPLNNYGEQNAVPTGKTSLIDGVPFHQTGMNTRFSRALMHYSSWLYRRMESVLFENYITRVAKSYTPLPDLIHAHTPHYVGWPALRAARKLGIKFVYEVRGLWEESGLVNGAFSEYSVKRLYYKELETALYKKADGIVTISECLRREVIRRGGRAETIGVVPNGIDPANFPIAGEDKITLRKKLGIDEEAILIGYIGSIRKYEDLDDVIRALALVNKDQSNIKFLMVGNGEDKQRLISLADDLGVRRNLISIDKVPHEDIHKYYQILDVFIIARKNPHMSLIMPLKPLEALAMAKPIIISDLEVMHEIVKDELTGMFYQPGNVEALAGAILKLANDPDLREYLGNNARKDIVENFCWEKVINRYNGFYSQILAGVEPGN